MRRPSGSKSPKNTLRTRVGPRRVVRSVDDHQGLVLEHFEAPVELHRGEPFGDDLRRQRGGEESLDRGEGNRRVVPLVSPMQGHERLRVDRRRGAQVDDPTAEGELIVGDVEVLAAVQPTGSFLVGQHSHQLRVGGSDQRHAARLDDPCLLAGDVSERRPGELVVVHADVGDHSHLRLHHVGGVPATEQPDLDDRDVDGDVGEPAHRRRRDRLEVARVASRSAPRGWRRRRSARRSRRRRSARSCGRCAR